MSAGFNKEKALQHLEDLLQKEETVQAAPKSKKELEEEVSRLEAEAAVWRRRLEDVVLAHQWIIVGDPPTSSLGELVTAKAYFAGKLAKIYEDVVRVLMELDKSAS